MLLKDEVKMSVPADFIKNIMKGKPMVFELSESQKGYNPVSKKKEAPKGRGVLTYYTIQEKNSTVEMRYAETKRPGKAVGGTSVWVYNPDTVDFMRKGTVTLDPSIPNHAELAYILYYHPCRDGSPNANKTSQVIFRLIDKQQDAAKNNATAKARSQAESKIFGWSEAVLKEMAYGFGNVAAHSQSVDELQEFLVNRAALNPSAFLAQIEAHDMTMKAAIVEGQSLGVVNYNVATKSWSWGTAAGEKVGNEICKNDKGQDEVTRLIKFFNTSLKEDNQEYFLEYLDIAKTGRDAPVKEKSE